MHKLLSDIEIKGYQFFSKLEPENSIKEISSKIGKHFEVEDNEIHVSELVPKLKDEATANTYSGLFGLNEFPFHTDLAHWRFPPRFLVLRCIIGFEAVPTLLLDGYKIADKLGKESLSRALVKPRRPLRGKLPLMSLLQIRAENTIIRWDNIFLKPASDLGKAEFEKFQAAVNNENCISISMVSSGDTLVIDNWRMLHARAPVPENCRNRKLERIYLESLH